MALSQHSTGRVTEIAMKNFLDFCLESIRPLDRSLDPSHKVNGVRVLILTKSKYTCRSRPRITFSDTKIHLNGNDIDFVKSANNLGMMSSYSSVALGKVYENFHNLWAAIDSILFSIRLLLLKSYLMPSL